MAGSHGRLLALSIVLLSAGRLCANRAEVSAPERDRPILSSQELAARIDRMIEAEQSRHRATPAPLADDAEFLRRIYLDLSGRIPSVLEAKEFLADGSAERRTQLIDRLLDKNSRYALHMGNTWCDIIMPQANTPSMVALHTAFRLWLTPQFQENVAYGKMVRELLTVPLETDKNAWQLAQTAFPGAFFYANERKAENVAASTARVFLGVRLECAQCHNHPFARWTRQQFWQFAAFFEESRRGYSAVVPATGKVVTAGFLDGTAPKKDADGGRKALADWVTSPDNPRFARTAVNRLWAHFFGIGIIEPMDDEATDENPPSHPDLLAELSFQFVANDFDVKYLIRALVLTKAYQRTSMVETTDGRGQPRLFTRMAVKGMSADQLYDSLALATGYEEPKNPQRQQQTGLEPPKTSREEILALFAAQGRKTETKTSILQVLALMNGKLVADAVSLKHSKTLTDLLRGPFTTFERIETLYLATLSRRPRDEEMRRLLAYVNQGDENQQRAALSDVFWALLNSPEFLFNH